MPLSDFDVSACRQQFPALARKIGGRNVIYLDGPAGSQVPERVADAVRGYLLDHNANTHGNFPTSRETDAILQAAHLAAADLLGADDPETIVFGANMTTLTFALSRVLARTWSAGDEVLVTQLDHDANVAPWRLAARDAGARVQQVALHRDDCTLDMDDLRRKLSKRTRLVAVGCASNAVGTVNPIREIVELAHAVGAEVFLDAVHLAPHRLIDVRAWNCDWLACSAYKFFGPHVGILLGRRQRLETLPVYKVRPASEALPERWLTGTQSHEGLAGLVEAVEYLSDVGRRAEPQSGGRRDSLAAAYRAIAGYERDLIARLLTGLARIKHLTIHGITNPERLDERVPTVGVTSSRIGPAELAEQLAARGIFVWHGNFFALSLSEALGLEPAGMVRIGLVHYNTMEEVDRLLEELAAI